MRRPAGDFSTWLIRTESLLESGRGTAEPPCGECTACCRSHMFVHIGPDENETIRRIPRGLLFPAPGRPKGHLVMGYNDQGHCPMLIDNRCSIYEHRPQTCRSYDCRVFAATGVRPDQPEIAERVAEWEFAGEHGQLRAAAAFLEGKRELFPAGVLPGNPGDLAVFAVKVHRLFAELRADAELVEAICSHADATATESRSRS